MKPKRPAVARRATRTQERALAPSLLQRIQPDAAGIDCGATVHLVAVPAERDAQPVREFRTSTGGLYALADWLVKCGIKTVALESTGVYFALSSTLIGRVEVPPALG